MESVVKSAAWTGTLKFSYELRVLSMFFMFQELSALFS